jgi:hypothetical protein
MIARFNCARRLFADVYPAANESASPLGEGERIEVRRCMPRCAYQTSNPHPPLSLEKGEAKTDGQALVA